MTSAIETAEFRIHEPYRDVCQLGVIQIEQVAIAASPPALKKELDRFCLNRGQQFTGKEVAEIPGVQQARSLFLSLGLSPSKTRPCSETFLRHVLSKRAFPSISNLVDLNNYCSAEAATPVCVYDLDALAFPLQLRPGGDGESFDSIRGSRIEVSGRPVLADRAGPFGSPFADSARARIHESTSRALVVWYAAADYRRWMLEADLQTYAARVQVHRVGRPLEPFRCLP